MDKVKILVLLASVNSDRLYRPSFQSEFLTAGLVFHNPTSEEFDCELYEEYVYYCNQIFAIRRCQGSNYGEKSNKTDLLRLMMKTRLEEKTLNMLHSIAEEIPSIEQQVLEHRAIEQQVIEQQQAIEQQELSLPQEVQPSSPPPVQPPPVQPPPVQPSLPPPVQPPSSPVPTKVSSSQTAEFPPLSLAVKKSAKKKKPMLKPTPKVNNLVINTTWGTPEIMEKIKQPPQPAEVSDDDEEAVTPPPQIVAPSETSWD